VFGAAAPVAQWLISSFVKKAVVAHAASCVAAVGEQARQEAPEPGQQQAAVVADGAEDGVDRVDDLEALALEPVAAIAAVDIGAPDRPAGEPGDLVGHWCGGDHGSVPGHGCETADCPCYAAI
jgi:hypothetical protein